MPDENLQIPIVLQQTKSTNYRAFCNGHVGGWMGECRTSRSDANTDATSHDQEEHSGEKWAFVATSACTPEA